MKFGRPFLFILCITTSIFAAAQERIDTHACTRNGKDYNCDQNSFDRILHVSRTVSVKTLKLDPSSSQQLNKLAHALGKTVRSSDADLTFVLSEPDNNGIYYGPSDKELAIMRVYYGSEDGRPGKLVWVESYYGQPDTPWPIIVNHLARQFRERFKR